MISLLGSFKLTLRNKLAPVSHGSKSGSLLTYLALDPQRCLSRSQLLEQLWPESTDLALAGQSLNSLIYQLNKLTKQCLKHVNLITHESGYYYLNLSENVGIDIDYFDAWRTEGARLFAQGEDEQGIIYYERALALYQGDLSGGGTNIQAVIERERLRAAFLDSLASLADYSYSRHNPTRALAYIHRLLRHEPCREDAHRLAMRCYVRLGNRSQALRQYQLCCQILAAEFDAKPEATTETLFHQIRLDPASI
jgi:DNA-binding SARP family transcriptional activator